MPKNDFVKIFYIFFVSRFIVYFFGMVSSHIFTKQTNLLIAFCKWDCDWYSDLIQHGYDIVPHLHPDGNAANWAFFPVFPKTVALLSEILDVPFLHISYIVNNLAFFLALYYLFLYVKKETNEDIANTSVLLMAFSPYSLYFSIPYTESLFFLFLILTFYFAVNGKWIYAGLIAALLSGTRALGVMVVFPMLIIAIQQIGFKNLIAFKIRESYQIILAILLAPMGLFLYMQFLYIQTGDALAFSHIQIAWERYLQNPFTLLFSGLQRFGSLDFYLASISMLGFLLSFVLLFKKRYAEATILLITIFIPLSSALTSMPRYTFSLFPVYIALSILLNKYNTVKLFTLLFFSAGLAFMSTVWVTTKWLTV